MIDWATFKAQLQTNPGKLLKSVLLLAGCFLVIWILVVAQSGTTPQQNVQVRDSGRLDSLRVNPQLIQSQNETYPQAGSVNRSDKPDAEFSALLPVALLFLIIIGGVWFWIRSKDQTAANKLGGNIFTPIASQQLPGGQHLLVIKLNEEYWVMTTGGAGGMTLQHRYTPDEWHGLTEPATKNDWKSTFLETLQHTASTQKKSDS